MDAAIKHYDLADLAKANPDFVAFLQEIYAKRGWVLGNKVHIDLREIAKRLNKRPEAIKEADDFFYKHGTLAEKPKEVKIL